MYPKPLIIQSDNVIWRNSKKVKMEDLTEKELLLRQVALTQSVRSILIFFVWIAILEIIGGLYLAANLLK